MIRMIKGALSHKISLASRRGVELSCCEKKSGLTIPVCRRANRFALVLQTTGRLSVVHEYYLVRQSGASQAARRRLASDL